MVTARYASMILLALLLLPACGKNVERQVRDAARQFDGLDLPASQVEVVKLEESGDFAIAELRVSTAVKLVRKGDGWEVDEVRLGDRRWEKAETILAALGLEREKETRTRMQQVASGVRLYFAQENRLPAVDGFTALIDLLTPRYLQAVVRLDAWSQPFSYRALSERSFELRSAGPDGEFETGDDVVLREGP